MAKKDEPEAPTPNVLEAILSKLTAIVVALLSRPAKPVPPQAPVVQPNPPRPSGGGTDQFPDDTIPRPPVARTVATVHLGIARAQYSRERFPEKYTEDNPFGLYTDAECRAFERGENAINWGSKVWLDATAKDVDGHEFLRPDVMALGLAFNTEHHLGDCFIRGRGADENGQPKPGYVTEDTNAVGQGISAWLNSKGFMQQFQFFTSADGGAFAAFALVNGVKSNEFTIRVS